MDVAGNNSSTSDDEGWLMSPVGPVVAFVMEQNRILEMTSSLATGAAVMYSNKRRRLLSKKRGGSRPGRSANIQRTFDEFHERFMRYYFLESPRFNDRTFRQRFRCRKALCISAVDTITAHDDYFKQKPDAVGRLGMTPLHKVVVAWRVCYGYGNDAMDENYEVAASTN
jgi:hypothetical protein